MKRLAEDRLMDCLQADMTPLHGIRVVLDDEPREPVKTEIYSRDDPDRRPTERGPEASREETTACDTKAGRATDTALYASART